MILPQTNKQLIQTKKIHADSIVDLIIRVEGTTLTHDHGYALMSALSFTLPSIHENPLLKISTISGLQNEKNKIKLTPESSFRIRLPLKDIPSITSGLKEKTLLINGDKIKLTAQWVENLVPSPTLASEIVTIKFHLQPESFIKKAQEQLEQAEIQGCISILGNTPMKKYIKIKGTSFIGFPVQVSNLNLNDSIRLQELGLGGRKRMGAGFFLPTHLDNHHANPTH